MPRQAVVTRIQPQQWWAILQNQQPPDTPTKIVTRTTIAMICGAILVSIGETSAEMVTALGPLLFTCELLFTVGFIGEYGIRLWVAGWDPRYSSPRAGRWAYVRSLLGICDLGSILPYLIYLFVPFDYRYFALFRLALLVKLTRYLDSVNIVWNALRSRKEALLMIVFIEFVLVFFVAAIS